MKSLPYNPSALSSDATAAISKSDRTSLCSLEG